MPSPQQDDLAGVGRKPTAANRFCLDYHAEAQKLGPPVVPITDVHTHINGGTASRIYRDVCDAYGIERVYSMTHLEDAQVVHDLMGQRLRFIAVPNFMAQDRGHAFREGYLEAIERFHALGSRIVKFWCAPRSIDMGRELGDPTLMRLDNEWRIECMELAHSLGMMFMAHIADPDTWFRGKYSDVSVYGTKRDQYQPFEWALERYPDTPWIAAHMGGWPEDLSFLSELLTKHENLYLDTSATKWMIRELSKHSREELLAFLTRWSGRILFGSDIVTTDQHLGGDHSARGMGHLASSEREAFDLYASRYWALRTLWESDYHDESNIADPDLMMLEPERFDEMSAPFLRGHSMPAEVLGALYRDSCASVLDRWHDEHR
jgi:amidohydrolase family protein